MSEFSSDGNGNPLRVMSAVKFKCFNHIYLGVFLSYALVSVVILEFPGNDI